MRAERISLQMDYQRGAGQSVIVFPASRKGKANYVSDRFPLDVDCGYHFRCGWCVCV
jgi:hypothetical protein